MTLSYVVLQLVVFAVWCIALVRVLTLAFRESLLWGFVALCAPCGATVFAIRRWKDARVPFLVMVGAFVVSNGLELVRLQRAVASLPDAQGRAAGAPADERPGALDGGRAAEDARAEAPARARSQRPPPSARPAARVEDRRRREPETDPLVVALRQVYERAASADADLRLQAVRAWRERRLDVLPNGRLKMIRALAGRAGEAEAAAVAASVQEDPPALGEVLACLEVTGAPPPVRRALLLGLRDRQDEESADRIARALGRLADTEDLLVEEVLVRYGRPRRGASQRLVAARGLTWARSAEGRSLLGAIRAHDLQALRPLLEAGEAAERVLGCELLVGAPAREAREAVKLALPLLSDGAPEVRQAAATALAALGDAASSWGLARALLRERDGATRRTLQQALVDLPPRDTLAYLQRLHRRPGAADRLAAQHAARALGTAPALRLLADGLTDADRQVKLDALRGLLHRVESPVARPVLLERHDTIRAIAGDRRDPEVQELAFQLDRALLLGGR